MFVTLEGVDGAGKSTQARLLAEALGPDTVLLREPGGTPVGERLRELLKDGSIELTPRAELLLFCAARAELVERVIRPALDAGRDVVCDRFIDSTVAYQGGARGIDPSVVGMLNEVTIAGCTPDRTVYLRLDAARALDRAGDRADATGSADRFEREGIAFQAEIAKAFERIAAAEPERIAAAEPERFVAVDAEGSVEEVRARVLAAVGVDR